VQERCYQCFRPKSLCFCAAIPEIDNRTDVLILQHVGERSHAFNTARIVHKALRRCRLIVDHNRHFGSQQLPISANSGLLYPAANAPSLADLPAAERPAQLVIIDGTWHQAKTIVRDVPQLQGLPCYRLAPTSPGQYRIRREPDAHSLSTLEATVAALKALEPKTVGLDQLLSAFTTMVESQLGQLASHAVVRQRKPRQSRPRNLPFTLLQDPKHLVIAYGEATPRQTGQRRAIPSPVSWVAQRLGSPERFSRLLQPTHALSETELDYMQLSVADFDHTVAADAFCHEWSRFLRRNDVLVVYHQRTWQLLHTIEAIQPRYLVLKSIFGNWRSGIRSMEEMMTAEGLPLPIADGQSRAHQRLDMAVAMVEHLRTHYGKRP
jgi:DTW domain-containing protein YfiP